MEKIKVKRVFATAAFAGSGEGYGLKVGKRYRIRIAYLVDSGGVQVLLDDTGDALCFITYTTRHDFEQEWKEIEKISRRKFPEPDIGV